MSTALDEFEIHPAKKVAEVFGCSVDCLRKLMAENGIDRMNLTVSRKNKGTGYEKWGMTIAQIRTLQAAIKDRIPGAPKPDEKTPKPSASIPGHDGKMRTPMIRPRKGRVSQ